MNQKPALAKANTSIDTFAAIRGSYVIKMAAALAITGVLLGILSSPTNAEPAIHLGRFPYPLRCAGLVVGISLVPDLVRLHGKGYSFGDDLGDIFYLDAKRSVTLRVGIMDGTVTSVIYSKGVSIPKEERDTAIRSRHIVSTYLKPNEVIGDICLGDTPAKVMSIYGKPTDQQRNGNEWVICYRAEAAQSPSLILYYDAEFTFVRNRLVRILLNNGE